MDDLVAFIEARLAEDQALAEAAAGLGPPRAARGVWTYSDGSDAVWFADTGQAVFTGAHLGWHVP